MLPAHPTSGYCDLQGRRPTIEDFHSIHLYPDVQFYGIFDGHTGNVASKYAASTLFDRLVLHLPELGRGNTHFPDGSDWKTQVEQNVSRAYKEIHESFLDALAFAPTMDQSGTTATALIVSKHAIVLSSLGDSRAVLSSTDKGGKLSAIQLTIDHVASDPTERDLVLNRGGRVSSSLNGLARVNGTLAITRSIGDAALASMLSRKPHVTSMKRDEIQELCGSMHAAIPCFVILASDGLWDVMTNQEAVDMVAQVVASYEATVPASWNHGGAFQEAAEVLAVDAFVRGSTDNIGVCVVAIV
jgi:serine/threonine protein phosphatase PrpC